MRTKFSVVALLSAALVLSACGTSRPLDRSAPPELRTLNVTGVGEVKLTPDIAYINIGVHTEAASPAEAVASNNANTEALASALTVAGVDQKDLSTRSFSIWQNTQYNSEGQAVGTTYVVDNSVQVTVRELDTLGNLLEAAIQAGANNITGIQFDVADKTEAVKDARATAVESARVQAQELASAAGVKLGEIQTIGYVEGVPSLFQPGKGGGGGGAAEVGPVPIQPGQLTLIATVSIIYEIK